MKNFPKTPTEISYEALETAFNHFNERLFGWRLPDCLITLQRKAGARGFYSHERFALRDGSDVTDEIALNPAHFKSRSDPEILSTLVHEMVHLWQYHFGTPGRGRYHNKEWANRMEELGLMPSSTGKPGGKRTGDRVTHYIIDDGDFVRACDDLIRSGLRICYVDQRATEDQKTRKLASKTRYTCTTCNVHAWAKPDIHLVCGDCGSQLKRP